MTAKNSRAVCNGSYLLLRMQSGSVKLASQKKPGSCMNGDVAYIRLSKRSTQAEKDKKKPYFYYNKYSTHNKTRKSDASLKFFKYYFCRI